MSSFNPLAQKLKENKIVGSNYVDWKRNFDLVLTFTDKKFVLTELCPVVPSERAPEEETQAYQKWKKADDMAKCYILVSMSNVLQHQNQHYETALDILLNLKEMFGSQGRSGRLDVMQTLMNTRMAKGTLVEDRVLKMMCLLNEHEILGDYIDGKTQVDMVLSSLTGSFTQFCLNYSMNKTNLNLASLLKELKTAEALMKKSVIAYVAENGKASKPKGNKKQYKVHKQVACSKVEGKNRKCKCFVCGKTDYWKPHCRVWLVRKQAIGVLDNQAPK